MKSFSVMVFSLSLVLILGGATARAQDAAALYKSNCAACHGADGSGATAMGKKLGVKSFHSPEVAKTPDQELVAATSQGKGKMPAYGKKLSDDQIKALIKYIRTLK